MQNDVEKVCRRCGTLNDERSLMCVRCGGMLDVAEEQKYDLFKGRLISGKSLSFFFVVLFTMYLFGMVFYGGPWLEGKLLLFWEKYMLPFYNNANLTYITFETVYTIVILLINSIAVSLIMYMLTSTKLLRKYDTNSTRIFICIYVLVSAVLMTVLKHQLNYIIILEHLISVILILPRINKRILKISI